MTLDLVIKIAAALSGSCSAVLWLLASRVPPAYPVAYLNHPPKHVSDQIDRASQLNGWAAAAASVSAALQAISMLLGS